MEKPLLLKIQKNLQNESSPYRLISLYKCLDLDQYSLYTPIGSIKKDSLKKIITGNKAKHILLNYIKKDNPSFICSSLSQLIKNITDIFTVAFNSVFKIICDKIND